MPDLSPNLLGIDINQLALVHRAEKRPGRNADGNLVMETSFEGSGGHGQIAPGTEGRFRQTLHFALQAAVSDHVYGSFEGRPFLLVAPLIPTLLANGRPESLLTSDVAFFPEQGQMRFPGAVMVEVDASMPSTEFARWDNDVLRVNPLLSPANLKHAQELFAHATTSGVDMSPFQSALASSSATQMSAPALIDMALGLALARINAPSLNAHLGQELGAPMGFDGWAETKHVKELARYVNEHIPANGMGDTQVSRHSGMPGDRLFSAVNRSNADLVEDLAKDAAVSPRIRAAAKEWQDSAHLSQARRALLVNEILNGPDKITDANGAERPGMVRSLFGPRVAVGFEHPKMGMIQRDELEGAIKAASPDTIKQIDQSLQARSLARISSGQDPHPADEALIGWIVANDASPTPVKGFSQDQVNARRALQKAAISPLPLPPPPLQVGSYRPR